MSDALPSLAMTEPERLANMKAFEAGLPFEISRWLTTIACHCLCIRDGLDDRDELTWCVERTLLDLANDIRAKLESDPRNPRIPSATPAADRPTTEKREPNADCAVRGKTQSKGGA